MFTNQDDTDNYETDPNGWLMIERFIPKDKKIWSPFFCTGKQKEIFRLMGHDIIHEDRDFFSYMPTEDFDLIIDNPSFSNFKEVRPSPENDRQTIYYYSTFQPPIVSMVPASFL